MKIFTQQKWTDVWLKNLEDLGKIEYLNELQQYLLEALDECGSWKATIEQLILNYFILKIEKDLF